MDCSEAQLDIIEAQRSTRVSHDQGRQTYFPMNLLNRPRTILGEGIPLRETESASGFLRKLSMADLYHMPGESVLMTPQMFSQVSPGNKQCVEKMGSSKQMACLKSDRGDSPLHLAAAWGHLELVESLVQKCPSLLLVRNSMDQLPLHVAAHAGCLAVVEAFVELVTYFSNKALSEEERETLNIYVMKDKYENTPLHAALKERHWKTAACLVHASERASFLANKDGISSLHTAAEAGKTKLVKAMFYIKDSNGSVRRNSNLDSQLEGRKYLVHTALKAKNIDVLDIILKEYPILEGELDEEGRTCLSYGASIGFYEGVSKLLLKSPESAYICDNDGAFPIHIAAMNGHTKIIKKILERCPDSEHLLNKHGQNILHIAAKNGEYQLVRDLQRHKRAKHLSGGQDSDGNTPLHLATIKWNHGVVRPLSMDIDRLFIRNKSGSTALDIAEKTLNDNYIYQERMTLLVLLLAHSTRDSARSIKSLTKRSNPLASDSSNDYINALLLVAALVATVTFAAGFTIPGGYNSSAPNLGRATLATNPNLYIFLILDTLAMQSSVVAIATLIWAQLGDSALAHRSVVVALPFLLFSLISMPVAFHFGVVLTIGHVKGLSVVMSIISYVFFGYVLLRLLPQFLLQLPHVHPLFGLYISILAFGVPQMRHFIPYYSLTKKLIKWLIQRLVLLKGRYFN